MRQKNCIHCGLTFTKCAKCSSNPQKIDERVCTPTGKRYSLPTPQWVYDQVGARPPGAPVVYDLRGYHGHPIDYENGWV